MIFLAAMFFAAVEIDLSGEWRLSGADQNGAAIECAVTVPGDVHSALLAQGLMGREEGMDRHS